MDDVLDLLVTRVLPHWPFVFVALVFMLIGEVSKHYLWTKDRCALPGQAGAFWRFGRATLPLHPVVSGLALGPVWRNPTAGVDLLIEAMAYFALAGVASVFGYDIIQSLAKQRGVTIDVFDSIPPPTNLPLPDPSPETKRKRERDQDVYDAEHDGGEEGEA